MLKGASHMADGYSRTKSGNIGVCIGTSGPAGTDMITGLYAASADSIPYGQNINQGRLGFSRVI
jgi:tartronate-semialdehyde synthase